jgi:hypothetical protein
MRNIFVTFLFSLVIIAFSSHFAHANDWTFTDTSEPHNLSDINSRGGWVVTNYNEGAKIVTHDMTPINAGIFQMRMRHNKSGLFYFNALTSDAGGQILFTIQFTEANGILLEESDKQIALLTDYVADQWYLFTIDFDSNRGERGTFRIKIDDGDYKEFQYVDSESVTSNFAQMVFGSEGSKTANSAFSNIMSPSINTITANIHGTATSTVTTVDIDGAGIVVTDATSAATVINATTSATSSEQQNASTSISADTNNNEIITTPF